MYRTLLGLTATVAVALLLAALSFSASTAGPAEVRFVNGAEPKSLDPTLLTGQPGGRIALALYEGLTQYDPETMLPKPGVAKSWTISDDGLTYTFELRGNSQWSDGTPVTAADFIYSWRRRLDPAVGSEYAYMLHMVRGAKELNTFDGHATELQDKVLPKLRTAAQAGAGLEKRTWTSLLSELPLNDALQAAPSPTIREILDGPPTAISQQQLDALIAAIPSEIARMRAEAAKMRDQFGKTVGLIAPHPQQLIIELAAPTPYFLATLCFYTGLPVPRHVIEEHGAHWFLPETHVGNGAFEMETWRVNDRIRLKRSETYWDKENVRASSMDVIATENRTTSLNLYLTGEVDWIPSLYPPDLIDQLKSRSDFYVEPSLTVYFYRINTRNPPLNDRRVRQALNMAIDRETIVVNVMGAGQVAATGFVPRGIPGYHPPAGQLRLDVPRARQLLAEAGFPEGKGFPEIGIVYNTDEAHKKVAEVIAAQLGENLGIVVKPYNQEWQSYQATMRAGDYDMGRMGWIGDYVDPNTFLDMWLTNGGNNKTGFSSARYDAILRATGNMQRFAEAPDALLAQLKESKAIGRLLKQRQESPNAQNRQSILREARLAMLAEAESILINEEFPVLPIYFYVTSGLRSPKLRGLYTRLKMPDNSTAPNLQGLFPIRALWMDDGP